MNSAYAATVRLRRLKLELRTSVSTRKWLQMRIAANRCEWLPSDCRWPSSWAEAIRLPFKRVQTIYKIKKVH